MTVNLLSTTMSRAELASLACSWMLLWHNGCLDNFDKIHSIDFIDKSASGRNSDRAAFREGISELYASFPDFQATTTFMAIDEYTQTVTVRWTATGTHQGAFMGIPATFRVIPFEGIEILRCQAGKITERWGEWNGLEILENINAHSRENLEVDACDPLSPERSWHMSSNPLMFGSGRTK